jgi:hypothetical protein
MTGVAIQNAGPGQTIQHLCALCGAPFLYRFDEFYNSDQLRPVDLVCRTCFPKWVVKREAGQH